MRSTTVTAAAMPGKWLSFICLILLISSAAVIRAEVVDRVVAEINNEVITLTELYQEGRPFLRKLAREVAPENRDAAMEQALQDVLDGLIDKMLIAQEAAERGIEVNDEEVDQAIERILAASNLTRRQLAAQIEENGLSMSSYRNNLKSQLLQSKLVSREVSSRIVITEEMMLDYYDDQYTRKVSEGGYYLLQIGIGWGDEEETRKSAATLYEDKLAARKKAERLRKLAASGQNFAELARKFSELPSAADGGDIGVFTEAEMASYMRDAVTGLEAGQISPVVETPVGFQFFKLLSSEEGGIVIQAPYESVKEQIREELFQQALEKEFAAWIQELKKSAYIKRML